MAAFINGFDENNRRISTQQLLQKIYAALEAGETEFEVLSSGHHDIGGPLWTKDGTPLKFTVKNPGQRVGAFGLAGTEIVINGPAPADVGWLNAGATVVLKGDGGDTTAHCAASGKIYVGGRGGTRTGSLMKRDPAHEAPELWVLKNVGSFSFEFMGGGVAVVCGYDSEEFESVLGDRACVGMVGGTIYVRGPIKNLDKNVWLMDLDDADQKFLTDNMPVFLEKIDRPQLLEELTDLSQWRKIVAKSYEERQAAERISLREFRLEKWVEGGIFGDVVEDDYDNVANLVNTGDMRLKVPHWMNKAYAAPCQAACPTGIPTQDRIRLLRENKTKEALELVLQYSPFPASVCGQVCPNLCMEACSRRYLDHPVAMKELGRLSQNIEAPELHPSTGKKVAVLGGGPAGLSVAWQLALRGHSVVLHEADKEVGGKLRQAIPADRLPREVLNDEINRIKNIGVDIRTNSTIDKDAFDTIRGNVDAIVVATGAHNPVVIPFPGHERLVKGLEFLKDINNGLKPKVGRKVVVIGAGNAGMDVAIGAYHMGAEQVTAIDVQRPAAYQKEIDQFEKLGGKIEWPVFTERITEEGLHTKDGRLIEADTVIISIGERPDLSYVPREWLTDRGMMETNDCLQVKKAPGVFALGDTIQPGLLTHAIGSGRKVADYIDDYLSGRELIAKPEPVMIPQSKLHKESFMPQNRGRFKVEDVCSEVNRCISCGTCRDCSMCLETCPEGAIVRQENPDGTFEYISDEKYCIGCGLCAGVCPCGIWQMEKVIF